MKTFDPTKPVQTRDGRPARIVSTSGSVGYPILAVITGTNGAEECDSFTIDGRQYINSEEDQDLVNVVETVTEYVNIGASYSNYDAARSAYYDWPVVKLVREKDGPVISAEVVTG